MANNRKRLTVLADPDFHNDVIKYFEGKPVTETALRLMRAGIVLEQADIIDQLLLLIKKGMVDDLGELETLKKAIEIAEIVKKKTVIPEPETLETPVVKQQSVFG